MPLLEALAGCWDSLSTAFRLGLGIYWMPTVQWFPLVIEMIELILCYVFFYLTIGFTGIRLVLQPFLVSQYARMSVKICFIGLSYLNFNNTNYSTNQFKRVISMNWFNDSFVSSLKNVHWNPNVAFLYIQIFELNRILLFIVKWVHINVNSNSSLCSFS